MSKSLDIAKELGHEPEDVKSVSVEPGRVVIVTNDGERHVYEEDFHGQDKR